MPENEQPSPDLYALLIGIDCYLPNRLPGGASYGSLSGCVADINRVEAFLTTRLGLTAAHLLKLTSTYVGAAEPPEPRAAWPTYDNMVAAFKRIRDMARPGDQVYVHYSGHGGRQRTAFPALKGPTAFDEGLVPLDIGRSQYLLDVELAYLFQAMVDRGLILTVVLDSCHSGGATRGPVTVRGIAAVDEPRPAAGLAAPEADLAAVWQAATRGQARTVKPGGGWLPEPAGYVLLAACRPTELAFEYEVEPGVRGGALTYWLLDSLKQLGPGLSYAMLHRTLLAKIHGLFAEQSPQLQGDGDRAVLGSERVRSPAAVTVLQVDTAAGRVRLAAGQAQGLRPGAQFVVYPPRALDFGPEQRQALATIDELGATDSWARLAERYTSTPVEQGAQAVLIDPGSIRLRRAVAPFVRDDLPPGVDQAAALATVEAALAEHGRGWLALAAAGQPADYQVALAADGASYEIWDPAGQPLPNITPPLQIGELGAARGVVERLAHLARYHAVLHLDNHDDSSPLLRALDVKLMRPQPDYVAGDPLELQPIADPGGAPTLLDGELVVLCVKNRSRRVLNVAALALQSDWAITQVHPTHQDYDTLAPDEELRIRLRVALPPGRAESRDVLKVLATVGPAGFKWLELPPLDGRRGTRSLPANPLEALLDAVAGDRCQTRALTPVVDPGYEWTMAQLELWTRFRP